MLQTNIMGYFFLVRFSLTCSCHIYNFDDSIIIHLYICQSDWGTRSNQFLLKWASNVVPNPEDTYYYWGILNGMYFSSPKIFFNGIAGDYLKCIELSESGGFHMMT